MCITKMNCQTLHGETLQLFETDFFGDMVGCDIKQTCGKNDVCLRLRIFQTWAPAFKDTMKMYELIYWYSRYFFFRTESIKHLHIYVHHLDSLHLFSPPYQRPTNPFQQKLCSLRCFLPEINPPLPWKNVAPFVLRFSWFVSVAMYLKVLGARSEEEAEAYRKEKGIIAQVVRGRQAPKPFQTFQEILGSRILMNF